MPPRKQILPNPDAIPATLFILRSHLWGHGGGAPWARLGQKKLAGAWPRVPIRAQLGVPVGSQDGVCIRALPPGTAPIAPQDGACLLLLELLSVLPRDLHGMVLGHGGLGVPCPLEESHL